MLLMAIEASDANQSGKKVKQSHNSCSELYGLLRKFHEVLSKEAKAVQT